MRSKRSFRQDKVAKVLTDALAKVLDEKRGFMGLPLLTINHIKLSADLKIAKVYFSFFSMQEKSSAEEMKDEARVEDILNSHSKILRHEISDMVYLKSIPDLRFHYDTLLRESNEIIQLINSIKQN